MGEPSAHSLFSASGGEGWSFCHGKPALTEGRHNTSFYADEGTAAHTLSSWVMVRRIKGLEASAADYIGTKIKVRNYDQLVGKWIERIFVVDTEMAEHVDTYVDDFFRLANPSSAERMCEQRVNYAEYLGVPKDLAWGTSDGVAILWDQPELEWEGQVFPAGDELQVHDLKYGMTLVGADTLQLKLYGAGTYYAWEHLADFTRVRLFIHQPRKEHLVELVITPAELIKAVRALRPAVPRVLEAVELAKALRAEGLSDLEVGEQLDERGFLRTSDKACAFCDALAICPRQIAENTEAFSGKAAKADDFDDLTVDTPTNVREYGGNYLAAAYARLNQIEDWSKAVRAEIDRRVLLKGEKFDGIKVVAGRKGKRNWTAAGAVEAFALALPAPVRALMFKSALITPAQAEKALKTSPSTWAKLQVFIDQAEGKPAVVPVSDNRASISHKSVRESLDDLTEDEETPAPRRQGASAGRDRHPFR